MGLAKALRINTSLQILELHSNRLISMPARHADIAFAMALRLNPVRPKGSRWVFYANSDWFCYTELFARHVSAPSMLQQLANTRYWKN